MSIKPNVYWLVAKEYYKKNCIIPVTEIQTLNMQRKTNTINPKTCKPAGSPYNGFKLIDRKKKLSGLKKLSQLKPLRDVVKKIGFKSSLKKML